MEEKKIKLCNGYFDVVGKFTVDAKTFELNKQGKNNTNWLQNVFNPKIEADTKSMFMRFSSGYDSVKGKTIYTMSNETSLQVSFADRNNENILKLVDEKSFLRVGIGKKLVKNEETQKEYKEWEYKTFLDAYDLIAYLQQIMVLGSTHKVRIVGRIKFGTYNGEVSKNYDIQTIYLLDGNEDEDKILPPRLDFTQNVIITKDCIVDELDEKGIATINSLVMTKEKKEYKTIPVKLLLKSNDEKGKQVYKNLISKLLTVDEGVVRRINLECSFEVGYVSGKLDLDNMPDEAKELLDMGLYSLEDIEKLYAVKDFKDELIVKKPKIKLVDEKPVLDYSDSDYTIDDLNGKEAEVVEDEVVETSQEVSDLMSELENM